MRAGILFFALALAASSCGAGTGPSALGPTQQATAPDPGGVIRDFDLTARPATIELRPGLAVNAWTYNGTVPGPLIRARVGDLVRVHLNNQLPEGTTIHWHGLAVPNGEDGVAGVTQDAVPPGRSVTYAFVPQVAGTYWYHSHQRGAKQVDRGLYGSLVIDPATEPHAVPDVDQTLVYDEWPWGLEKTNPPPPSDPIAMTTYVTYSVNGKTGGAIEPVKVSPGQLVRLRLVNVGYVTHYVYLDGQSVTLTAFDGHSVSGGPPTDAALPLGAGERIDLQFVAPRAPLWLRLLDAAPPAADVRVPIVPSGTNPVPPPANHRNIAVLDLLSYSARAVDRVWPVGTVPNRTYTLTITKGGLPMPDMPEMAGMTYQINGKSFPDTDTLVVTQGDYVEINFVNLSDMEHAMHLHGHVFQVLSRNGEAVSGIIDKDTVVVPPQTSISIGFHADNPGWWMIHCHELYHAEGGLMTLVRYEGVTRLATLGGQWSSTPD